MSFRAVVIAILLVAFASATKGKAPSKTPSKTPSKGKATSRALPKLDLTAERADVLKDIIRYIYNYHPDEKQQLNVQQFTAKIVGKQVNVFLNLYIEEDPVGAQKDKIGSCTQQTFNLTRSLSSQRPYHYSSLGSQILATWEAAVPACSHPPPVHQKKPPSWYISPPAVKGVDWSPLVVTSSQVRAAANYAITKAFPAPTLAEIKNGNASSTTLTTVLSARSEALVGGTLYEIVVSLSRAPVCPRGVPCPEYIMMVPPHRFLVFEQQNKMHLYSASSNVVPTSDWATVDMRNDSAVHVLKQVLSYATNPYMMMGVSHCPRATAASVQTVPGIGKIYQITADVTTKAVVLHPGKGRCGVFTYAVLVKSSDTPTSRLSSGSDAHNHISDDNESPLSDSLQSFISSTGPSTAQCQTPWPCEGSITSNDDRLSISTSAPSAAPTKKTAAVSASGGGSAKGIGWVVIDPTSQPVRDCAAFAVFKAFPDPSAITISTGTAIKTSLSSILAARSEALNGGILFEIIAILSRARVCYKSRPCTRLPATESLPAHRFLVFQQNNAFKLVAAGTNINPTSGWSSINPNFYELESILAFATNPRGLIGVTHCSQAVVVNAQTVPGAGLLYLITAHVTTKAVVFNPGAGTCRVSTFAVLVKSPQSGSDDNVAISDDFVLRGYTYPGASNSSTNYLIAETFNATAQCATPWPCDRPHHLSPGPYRRPLPPTTSPTSVPRACSGPVRMMCIMGTSAQCVQGEWRCVPNTDPLPPTPTSISGTKSSSPTLSPTATAGPDLQILPALFPFSAWVPLNVSSPAVKTVAGFAAAAVNNDTTRPGNQGMVLVTQIDAVLSARMEPAGSNGVMYELVASLTKRPNCKPGMMCPMFIMCAQYHFVVFESRSRALTLADSHEISGGCGGGLVGASVRPSNSAAALASNWTAASSQAAMPVVSWYWMRVYGAPLGKYDKTTIVKQAFVQTVPAFGSIMQVTASVRYQPARSNATYCSMQMMMISPSDFVSPPSMLSPAPAPASASSSGPYAVIDSAVLYDALYSPSDTHSPC